MDGSGHRHAKRSRQLAASQPDGVSATPRLSHIPFFIVAITQQICVCFFWNSLQPMEPDWTQEGATAR